jgi:phage-related protein
MFDRTEKLRARFYATASGRKPVRDWILELDKSERVTAGKDIQKVEFGWPIGLSSCRLLGSGLYEVRSDLACGRMARVTFCIVRGELVLLHGFVKKSQKTPAGEIELARRRQKEIA